MSATSPIPTPRRRPHDVAAVLSELDIDIAAPGRVIEVWNKIDLLPPDERPPRIVPPRVNGKSGGSPLVVSVAALTGEGLPELLAAIEERLAEGQDVYRVELAGEGLDDLHRLYELGEVLNRQDRDDGIAVEVRVPDAHVTDFRRAFPDAMPVRDAPTGSAAAV